MDSSYCLHGLWSTVSEPLTVNEILNNRKQDPKGTRIRMAGREELTLSESGVTCDVFGTLVIGGTYNEKYLLVVRLTSEGMHTLRGTCLRYPIIGIILISKCVQHP